MASAVVRDTSDEREAASLLSYIAMAMAVALMLGPMVGGVLDSAFGWRANFGAYAAMGTALLWLVWTDLTKTSPAPADTFATQMSGYPELLQARRFWG